MKWTLIRYRTHPEKTEENAALIRAVFEELQVKSPPGLRYMAMRLPGGEFIHLVSAHGEPNPLLAMPAFQAFQAGVSERQVERAVRNEAEILGDYRVLRSVPE